MPLSDVELRVLGALIEKDHTTPEGYPLSLQALVTACNQRTSRDPVTDFHLQDVMAAVNRLKDRGLAETVQEAGDRVPKHKHRFGYALDLNDKQIAVLAVLLLRGPQTPGELRSRTDRYATFGGVAEIDGVLKSLENRPAALVRNLGRGPGQSQDRWVHTLGTDEQKMVPRVRPVRPDANDSGEGEAAAAADARADPLLQRLEALEMRVAALESRSRGSS